MTSKLGSLLGIAQRAGAVSALPEEAAGLLGFWFSTHAHWPATQDTTEADAANAYCSTDSDRMKLWFGGGKEIDEEITGKFKHLLERLDSDASALDEWRQSDNPRAALSFIILTDQLTRNIFRGTAKCFSYDHLARETVHAIIDDGRFELLRPVEKAFALMPLEHSEDIADHRLMAEQLEKLIDGLSGLELPAQEGEETSATAGAIKFMGGFQGYLAEHTAVIAKYGRYPHRNKVLGRTSTEEEVEYLKTGSSWGQ